MLGEVLEEGIKAERKELQKVLFFIGVCQSNLRSLITHKPHTSHSFSFKFIFSVPKLPHFGFICRLRIFSNSSMNFPEDPQERLEWLRAFQQFIQNDLTTGHAPPRSASQSSSSREEGSAREKGPSPISKEETHSLRVDDLFSASKTSVSKSAKKVKKSLKECDLSDLKGYQDFKTDLKARHPDTERKRINDLREIAKKLKPLVKALVLASQDNIEANEFFTVSALCVQDLLKFVADEVRVSALCAEYSLDPKKNAPAVRRILDLDIPKKEQIDRVRLIYKNLQREKTNQVLESSLKIQAYRGGNELQP